MIKKFLKIALPALVLAAVLVIPVVLEPSLAEAVSSKNAACDGAGLTGADCADGGGNKISGVIENVINVLSAVVGIAAVIMIVVSGFKYITAAGEANKIASAKSTLIYAIVGLVIVAVAQIIVKFVIKNAT